MMHMLRNSKSDHVPHMHQVDTFVEGKNTTQFQSEVALEATCHTTITDTKLVSKVI